MYLWLSIETVTTTGGVKIKNTKLRSREWSIWTSLAALATLLLKGMGKALFVKRLVPIALITICLLVIFSQLQSASSNEVAGSQTPIQLSQDTIPPAQAHSLPPTLVQWQDATNSGDYFSQVKQTRVGYLVWSQFPVKVYVERPPDSVGESPENRRFHQWAIAVIKALQEWSVYLPLRVVEQQSMADITIWRSRPPLQVSFNSDTGQFQLPRARSAQTHYQLYISQSLGSTAILSHRCTIRLSPTQSDNYIQAAARHEIGHALGIWGHSPLKTDALYFSQVRNPPPISPRDINTLKRVYEQSTRLGWPLVQ